MNKKTSSEMVNLVIALVLSSIILMGWSYFFDMPRKKAEMLAMKAKAQTELQVARERAKETAIPENITPKTRAELLGESPRVRIKSDSLHGSISLRGLRFDDLTLAKYRETLDPTSPEVTLFTPSGDEDSYFAEFGWAATDKSVELPGPDTVWSASDKELSPDHPVTLTWKNSQGSLFTVTIALDDQYMFTINESAKDVNAKPLSLQYYAYINRSFEPATHVYKNIYKMRKSAQSAIVHEGPIGVFDGILQEVAYKKIKDAQKEQVFEAQAGWLGISDKYWFSAIIPANGAFSGHFNYYVSKGRDHFQTDYLSPPQTEANLHFFAGAKELPVLDSYANRYNIPLLDRAVDFGWLWFLAEPMFMALEFFHTLVGNFGVAILILTVIVKLLMFPLATKSFKSMSQMKTLQPKMAEIRERHKDDKIKMNQEVMELYKREKINPAGGCLPLLVQIPVFFSLYKVLYVTIEMRHAPFFGWIHDLSAPDPTNLFTLFGFAPWLEPIFPMWVPLLGGVHLHLGIWPIIMCATMVIQQHQSPPPPDPTQAKMMRLMPFFFLFLFSSFPAGLVIYWSWSNTLTILQQWHIMRTHGVKKK